MKSTSTILFVAACMGSCLILVFSGCGGPQIYPAEANRPSQPSQRPTALGETQLGTPEHELLAAKQDYVSAEQLLQDGNAAYGAKQYVQSWDKLQAADAAFRRAEETAVLAGLGQLERELVSDYGRLLNSEARGSRRSTSAARVSQGSAILRNGAGTDFQVIGKAQLGDTLSILAESGEWYRVRTGTGLIGWVSKLSVTKIRNL
jgi:hypothetical protein